MKNKKRILSIDGGGIKGVLPAAFLSAIENATGKRIVEHFDLIAGTSTGGIIALGLALGLSAKEILCMYEDKGPKIFDQEPSESPSRIDRFKIYLNNKKRSAQRLILPKYNPAELRLALEGIFQDRVLGESQTRLMIPAFDQHRREVHVFKTSHHSHFKFDWKEKVVDVALATAAAPTYFPTHEMENGMSLLDGGIWANNPTGNAVVEALGVLEWKNTDLCVLSLGNTNEAFEFPDNSGAPEFALKLSSIFMLGQSHNSMGTAKLLMGNPESDKRLIRIEHPTTEKEYKLDSANRIKELKGIGNSLARGNLPQLESMFFDKPCSPFAPCNS